MSIPMPEADAERKPAERLPIESVVERWADGWVDRDTIFLDPTQRTVTLRVQYLDDNPTKVGWLFVRKTVPILCDTVLFERVTKCESDIPDDEATLWLSEVRLEKGSKVEFPFSQGTLRIHTSDDTCIVSTEDTGAAKQVWTILGAELHWSCRAR